MPLVNPVPRRPLLAAGLTVPAAGALNTRTRATVTRRAGERFAFCSTVKTLVAAAFLRDREHCAPLTG